MQQSSNLIKTESLKDYEYLNVVMHGEREYLVLKQVGPRDGRVCVVECAGAGGYRAVADEGVRRAVLGLFQREEQERYGEQAVRRSA